MCSKHKRALRATTARFNNIVPLPVAVLGAGSWGTALALQLARNDQAVRLWGHNPEHLSQLRKDHENNRHLPGIAFPGNIEVMDELSQVLTGVGDIVIVVPSHAFSDLLQKIKPFVTPDTGLCWATKGLDPQTGQFMHQLIAQKLGSEIPIAILSGPSFAKELAMELPTAVSVASSSPEYCERISQRFHSARFRVYTNRDVIGVEIGGAVKNIMAIAAGISDGFQFGANARAALITRGLHEIIRFGKALGAEEETLIGLSGMGDLVLTCTGDLSRNRQMGLLLAEGLSVEEAERRIGQAVEGVKAVRLIHQKAKENRVDMPICQEVFQILFHGKSPQQAVANLLSREAKAER